MNPEEIHNLLKAGSVFTVYNRRYRLKDGILQVAGADYDWVKSNDNVEMIRYYISLMPFSIDYSSTLKKELDEVINK